MDVTIRTQNVDRYDPSSDFVAFTGKEKDLFSIVAASLITSLFIPPSHSLFKGPLVPTIAIQVTSRLQL
jgi:hypothetical protein